MELRPPLLTPHAFLPESSGPGALGQSCLHQPHLTQAVNMQLTSGAVNSSSPRPLGHPFLSLSRGQTGVLTFNHFWAVPLS